MCRALEEMRDETEREARHKNKLEIAERLLTSGKMSYEEISEMVELPVEEIKALAMKQSA